jgi:2'-5' RNA ligase
MRAFLALDLTPEVHARLVEVKRELAHLGAAVRWVRDDNLHVTVKFLGNVAENALDEVRALLHAALRDSAPMAASVHGLGAFPDLRRARVVWAGVECAPLPALAAQVDAAAARVGVAPETRPFRAHLTLGRVNGMRGWTPLARVLAARAGEDFGACVFAELVAFRSDLRPGGALYTKLWSIPFGG